MSPQQALPWLQEARTVSKDELAIFCVGALPHSTSLETTEILLPCIDSHQKQVIISGHLVQLGQKRIAKASDQSKDVALDSCQLVALTVWKDDFNEQTWQSLLRTTNSAIRQLMGDQGGTDTVVSMWGRSMRSGNRATSEQHAKSIQVHCTIPHSKLPQVLAKSGFSTVFATPKTVEGRIDEKWRVLWVPGHLPRVSAIANQTSGCLGLIKGKNSFGLRYSLADYPAAWKCLHPSEPVPDRNAGTKLYRISPLPYGCNHETLASGAAHVQWSLKPLKAVGPRSWLISSNDDPPRGLLLFNGNPLMAEFIPPKVTVSTQAIVAGPKPSKTVTPAKDDTNDGDPWMNYHAQKGLNTTAASSAPRQVEGPIQAEFTKHEERFTRLEQSIQDLQAKNETAAQNHQACVALIEQKDHAMKQHVADLVLSAKTDIENAFAAAMQQQSKVLESSLTDLKTLILEQSRAKAAGKRTREKPEGDMDTDTER